MIKFNQKIEEYIIEATKPKDKKPGPKVTQLDSETIKAIPLPSIVFSKDFTVEDALKAMFVFLNFSLDPSSFKNGLRNFLYNKEDSLTYDKNFDDQAINNVYIYFIDSINRYFNIDSPDKKEIRIKPYINRYGAMNRYSLRELQDSFKAISIYFQKDLNIKQRVSSLVSYPSEQQALKIFRDGTDISLFLNASTTKDGLEKLAYNIKKYKIVIPTKEPREDYGRRSLLKDILLPQKLTQGGHSPSVQYREIDWKGIGQNLNILRDAINQSKIGKATDLRALRNKINNIFKK